MNPYGIGRGFDKSRSHGWYLRIATRKQYFASEADRDREYERRMDEAKLYGEKAVEAITPAQRQLLSEIYKLAQTVGYAPMDVFERGLATVSGGPRTRVEVAAATTKLIKETEHREHEGLVGHRRLKDLRYILTRFSARFNGRDLRSITREEIDAYLMTLGVGPRSRINNARVIGRLFSWARIPNPVVVSDRVFSTPQIFEPPEVRRLFEAAVRDHRALVPMLVLQWFAGIRPTASQRMAWADLNFARHAVVIRAEISKLREPEIIEGLPDEFWAWAAQHRKSKGRIAPANHIKMNRRLHHALGYGLGKKQRRWPEDVARHTFASHLYPRLHSIDAVAKILCHRGSRVTLKHYVAKNVSMAQAESYFKVLADLAKP